MLQKDSQLIKERLGLKDEPPKQVNGKDAAVLILLRGRFPEIEVFLCVRSMNLRKHPGEVCFPGGMWEPGDSDLQETAIREAEEETGLGREDFEFLGSLPSFRSRFGVLVHPSVALLRESSKFSPLINPDEVEKVFWQPLADFLLKETHNSYVWDQVYTVHSFDLEEAHCYGFTAFICVVVAMCLFDRVPEFDLSETVTSEMIKSVGTKSVVSAIFRICGRPIEEHEKLYREAKL